jgi:hypothetical protein
MILLILGWLFALAVLGIIAAAIWLFIAEMLDPTNRSTPS